MNEASGSQAILASRLLTGRCIKAKRKFASQEETKEGKEVLIIFYASLTLKDLMIAIEFPNILSLLLGNQVIIGMQQNPWA
jgi:hypothetical protein